MVDFNNDTTIGTPAVDIVRVLVLEKLEYLLDAIEEYYKKQYLGADIDTNIIRSRLKTLYLQLSPALPRHLSREEIEDLKQKVESQDINKVMDAVNILLLLLDKFKLTRLDNRKVYDSSRPALEDSVKDL